MFTPESQNFNSDILGVDKLWEFWIGSWELLTEDKKTKYSSKFSTPGPSHFLGATNFPIYLQYFHDPAY